ncbi:MAG: MoaD/ThiS family protein [Planctomycetaceae bacterium]|nr:MoaD/ThiS family protein [Planctomycetaceae bacterium]
MRIKVKITGRQYDAAEVLPDELELSDGASIELALETLRSIYGPISPGALLAVSGEHLGTVADHRAKTLDDDDEVLIFSPVAGG